MSNQLRLVVREPRRTTRRDAWAAYEAGKREIADTALSAAEYERRLRALVDKLGV